MLCFNPWFVGRLIQSRGPPRIGEALANCFNPWFVGRLIQRLEFQEERDCLEKFQSLVCWTINSKPGLLCSPPHLL